MGGKKLSAFPYYGGKYSHLAWLLPLLPGKDDGIKSYVESFGGSMAVLLNREPCGVETYNDIHEDVVNFFRVLREHPDELIMLLNLTPYSRKEYEYSINEAGLSDVKRARRFFTHVRQAYGGVLIGNSWNAAKTQSARGMSKIVSAWWGAIDNLQAMASRILRVQIECRDAIKVIQTYDAPDALHYIDPPYSGAQLGYEYKYSNKQWKHLSDVLHQCDGSVAVSAYRNRYVDELFDGWTIYEQKAKVSSMAKAKRVEALYTNYG